MNFTLRAFRKIKENKKKQKKIQQIFFLLLLYLFFFIKAQSVKSNNKIY